MKKIIVVVFLFLVVVLIVPVAHAQCNGKCCDEEYPKVTVYGDSKINVLADKAYFYIRLRQEEKKLDKAFDESTKKINAISNMLTALGIKKENIKNIGYQYNPLYEGKTIFSSLSKPTSYQVMYSLEIVVDDLNKLGEILSNISEIPETSVFGLRYTSSKIDDLKREALKAAAADAKQKAMKLAEGSGVVLGKVIKIDSLAQLEGYTSNTYQGDVQAAYSDGLMERKAAPQIETGYIEIKGSCTVSFSIQ